MPNPACQVKNGAAAYQATTGGVNVTPGNTIIINLIDSAADTWSISCVYTDDLSSAATVSASLVIDTALRTATFVAPVAGRAYIFRSVVNNGIGPDGRPKASYTTTFGIYTLSGGSRVIAANETTESGASGWVGTLNNIVRGSTVISLPGNAGEIMTKATASTFGATPHGSVGQVLIQSGASQHVFGPVNLSNELAVINTLPLINQATSPTLNGFRLSLVSNTPFPTSDVTGASILYLTADTSASMALYEGSDTWVERYFLEGSVGLSGLIANRNYDVFAYYPGSVIGVELGPAWTNDTTRATGLIRQNGTWLLDSGLTPARRWVGTIRTTSATTTEDSAAKRFVWNAANKRQRFLRRKTATASWTYTSGVWRQAEGAAANAVEFVVGEATPITIDVQAFGQGSATDVVMAVGVGLDSTTVNSADHHGASSPVAGAGGVVTRATYRGVISAGYHKINWLEYGGTTATFFGVQGSWGQSGMSGCIDG